MKKIFYVFIAILFLPVITFARAEYSRSFEPSADSSPQALTVSVQTYNKDVDCSGLQFWGVQAIEHATGKVFYGAPLFRNSSESSGTFTLSLPPATYEEVTFICSEDGQNLAFQAGSLENDLAGDEIIFITQ